MLRPSQPSGGPHGRLKIATAPNRLVHDTVSEERKSHIPFSREACDCVKCQLLCVEIRKPQPNFLEVERLLDCEPCAQWKSFETDSQLSILHKVAQTGQVGTLFAILDAGLAVDVVSSLSRTALHYACSANRADVVTALLVRQADVNRPTISGMTPLHFACQSGADACVFALLRQTRQFVMVDTEDDQRNTPFSASRSQCVRWLIQEYRESKKRLAALRVKNATSTLSKREAASFGITLQSLIVEHVGNLRKLKVVVVRRRYNALLVKLFPHCKTVPSRIWSDIIMPYLGGCWAAKLDD